MISPETMGVLNGEPQEQQQQGDPTFVLTDWVRKSYMIAALAPEGIREQLTQAQTAFSGMLNGARADKRYEALASRRQWEKFASTALKENRQRIDEYGQIWADDKTSMGEKMQALRGAAMERGDNTIAQLVASPDQFTTFGKYFDMMSKQQADAEKATAQLDQMIKKIEQKLPPAKGGGVPSINKYMGDPQATPERSDDDFWPQDNPFGREPDPQLPK